MGQVALGLLLKQQVQGTAGLSNACLNAKFSEAGQGCCEMHSLTEYFRDSSVLLHLLARELLGSVLL